jgi:hypothetical protein
MIISFEIASATDPLFCYVTIFDVPGFRAVAI